MRRKPAHEFVSRRAKGRTIVIWDQIMDGEKLAVGLEPAQNRLHVVVAPARVDSAEKGVFEKPIEWSWRAIDQKIDQKIGTLKLGPQSESGRMLLGESNGRGRQIETGGIK